MATSSRTMLSAKIRWSNAYALKRNEPSVQDSQCYLNVRNGITHCNLEDARRLQDTLDDEDTRKRIDG